MFNVQKDKWNVKYREKEINKALIKTISCVTLVQKSDVMT